MEGLLNPLPGERPTGSFLLYEGTYDRIRESRRFDNPDLPRDIWEHDLKIADWQRVEDLCRDALTFRTKDLQIAAWWLEAALHNRGFKGLSEGVELLYHLCERFWSDVYPELGEDLDYRIAPFHWLNEKLAPQLMSISLANVEGARALSVRWGDWKQAVWLDVLKSRSPNDPEVQQQIERGPSKEDVLRVLRSMPSGQLGEVLASIQLALEGIRSLEYLLDERLESQSPSLVRLRENLSEIHGGLSTIMKTIPGSVSGPRAVDVPSETSPDPRTDPEANEMGGPADLAAGNDSFSMDPAPSFGAGNLAGRDAAYRSIEAAARYLRAVEPHSPAPYMILRAVAWGEKSLAELIYELRRNGLDLESLSSLLGLNEEEDM